MSVRRTDGDGSFTLASSACRGRVSPDPGGAWRSALVMSSGTTIAMSGLRSAMTRWCRVVTVKSRAAQGRSGIRAGRACGDPRLPGPARRARARSGDGRHLPLARPAVSAAGISLWQLALSAGCARCAAVTAWSMSSR